MPKSIEKKLLRARKVRESAQTLRKCCTREYFMFPELQLDCTSRWESKNF